VCGCLVLARIVGYLLLLDTYLVFRMMVCDDDNEYSVVHDIVHGIPPQLRRSRLVRQF
jgi:hypothetical protein